MSSISSSSSSDISDIDTSSQSEDSDAWVDEEEVFVRDEFDKNQI